MQRAAKRSLEAQKPLDEFYKTYKEEVQLEYWEKRILKILCDLDQMGIAKWKAAQQAETAQFCLDKTKEDDDFPDLKQYWMNQYHEYQCLQNNSECSVRNVLLRLPSLPKEDRKLVKKITRALLKERGDLLLATPDKPDVFTFFEKHKTYKKFYLEMQKLEELMYLKSSDIDSNLWHIIKREEFLQAAQAKDKDNTSGKTRVYTLVPKHVFILKCKWESMIYFVYWIAMKLQSWTKQLQTHPQNWDENLFTLYATQTISECIGPSADLSELGVN